MKMLKFIMLILIFNGLWADVIILKNGEKVNCKVLTAENDSLVTINYETEQIAKFAIDDILRVERAKEQLIKRDNSAAFGLLGGIIGGLAALSIKTIADLEDSKITIPLFGICISCGIVIGAKLGSK
ncbi:hypothetical protein KAT67_06165 [candidate division WOR-3 bacterium]|nr:hypothetical protein [candidate division WOR-3 bacterium]